MKAPAVNINDKYKYTTAEESVLSKNWACGSSTPTSSTEFIIKYNDGIFTAECANVKYAPAWLKLADEVIVNALDHFIRNLGTSHPVTTINFDFDPSGRIRIYNDGPGIEIAIHPEASEKLGKQIYVPTLIFGYLYQGSNRVQSPDCIIGGTNGLGGKLAPIYSIDSIVETVDNKLYFAQRWRDHKKIEEEPIVLDVNSPKVPAQKRIQHTAISFLPDYENTFKSDIATQYEMYRDILRARVMYAAAYVGYTLATAPNTTSGKSRSKQGFNFTFNGEQLPTTGLKSIAEIIFPDAPTLYTVITPAAGTGKKLHYKYPWELLVVITPNNYAQKHLSFVNGIVTSDGKHVSHINNILITAVSEKITKLLQDKNLKFNSSHVTKNMFVMLNTKVPLPSWGGQRKDILDTDIRNFVNYQLDTKFINALTDKIKDQILESIFRDYKKPKTKAPAADIDGIKYTPADWAKSPSKAKNAKLIITEGDSAKEQADVGITNALSRAEYGTMSTGGVIVNVRKQVTTIATATGTHIKKSTMLDKNAFICALIKHVGLNENYKYDPKSPTYKREMASLNYGQLLVMVDSDLDGKGCILGLILSLFQLMWPCLYETRFLGWFCTPIMRAYSKKASDVHHFYNLLEYEKWRESHDETNYDVKYYKGIGTHSRKETISMFANIKSHLFTYALDPRSQELFEVYFGKDPALRKDKLSQPSRILSPEVIAEQLQTGIINCSDHLEQDVDEYQKDNLARKLDHVIDGLNQGGRKIVNGAILTMHAGREYIVEKIAGEISSVSNYHHGGASIEHSIQGKAFVTPGGKQVPIFIPLSNFGSRVCGGKNAAAPRYTKMQLNTKLTRLLFPMIDYYTLEFNFEDGRRGEPKNFIPIIPLAVLESSNLPSHGWRLKTWARDIKAVIANVRQLIRFGEDALMFTMPPTRYAGAPYEWKGDFKFVRGSPYSFGKYNIIEDGNDTFVHIIELPLRVWTSDYIEDLKKKAKKDTRIIDEIKDESNDIVVSIKIKLKPGAIGLLENMNDLCFTDGIEEYFALRDHMDEGINLMGVGNIVHSFKDYIEPLLHWFRARRDHYGVRIVRIRTLLELTILMLENQIRYAEENINMRGLSDEEMEQLVADHKFTRICSGKINNPKFIPNDKLEQIILHGPKANYDYLLNMSDRRKSTQAIAKYKQELEDVKQKIIDLDIRASMGMFPGAVMFEEELTEFERVFNEGQSTFWEYENAGRFKL